MPMKRIAGAINLYHRGVMIGRDQRGSARAASRHVGLSVIRSQAGQTNSQGCARCAALKGHPARGGSLPRAGATHGPVWKVVTARITTLASGHWQAA
jgi:hypothetical protein